MLYQRGLERDVCLVVFFPSENSVMLPLLFWKLISIDFKQICPDLKLYFHLHFLAF